MPKIDRLWAFVQEDTGPDDEGVLAAAGAISGLGRSVTLPLIGADMERINSLRPIAQQIADATGKPVKLLTFSVRTEVAVLVPHAGERNGH